MLLFGDQGREVEEVEESRRVLTGGEVENSWWEKGSVFLEERRKRLRQAEKQDSKIRGVFMRGAQQQERGGWRLRSLQKPKINA